MRVLLVGANLLLLLACLGCSRGGPAMAEEVLRQNQEAMLALRGYHAECYTTITRDPPRQGVKYQVARLYAEKPNLMRYDMWRSKTSISKIPSTTPSITFACDGKQKFEQFGKVYRPDERISPDQMATVLEPWHGFYARSESILGYNADSTAHGFTIETHLDGSEQVEGTPCDRVKIHEKGIYEGSSVEEFKIYFISRPDHLVRRLVDHASFDGKPGTTTDAVIRNIDIHPKIDASIYRYSPPPGVELESNRKEPPPLASGSPAPNFSATDADNHKVRISDLKGKVVVLYFWASWCPPCLESMSHVEDVADILTKADIPVIVLAVDDGESRNAFDDWVSTHRKKYPHLRFAYSEKSSSVSAKLYRTSSIPMQYVIDRKGIIRASLIGYGGDTSYLNDAILQAFTK